MNEENKIMDQNSVAGKDKADPPVLVIENISSIKYEAVKDFGKSVSYETYEKAVLITKDIIKNTEIISGKDSTYTRNREQLYNVIFFTGDRGTGKTSTMLSYMEFLKDYYRNYTLNDTILNRLEFGGKYMFTGIEHIDASVLNDKEDILGIILSKMLKKWNDEERDNRSDRGIIKRDDYEYKKRQLRLMFNQVYERMKDSRNQGDITQMDSDMFLETLERLSFTGNLKQSFENLVKCFLGIMCYPGSERDITEYNHFLVISIDDLDLNIKHGFMLLEQIRNYLMIPNVIVLLSASDEQLERVCRNHYMEEFKAAMDQDMEEYVKRLSREYLEKMVPSQRQVRLTSGRKWQFVDKRQLKIKHFDKEESGTLYEIITKQMQDYFRARFYAKGKCLYYLVPDTLREASNWFGQIYELENPGDGNESSYYNNMQWFMENQLEKLCHKYMDGKTIQFLESLDDLEPYAQIRLIKEKIQSRSKERKSQSLLVLFSNALQDEKQAQDEAAVYIIYLTMKLSKLNYEMSLRPNDEKVWKSFLGYFMESAWGVWGNWESTFLKPMAALGKNTESPEFYNIAWDEFGNGNGCLSVDLAVTPKEIFNQQNMEIIRNYQYMLLFYKLDLEDSDNNQIWSSTVQKEKEIRIKLSSEFKGIFSLSGFALNLLEGAELVERFLDELPGLLAGKCGMGREEDIRAEMEQKKVSVFEQSEEMNRLREERKLIIPLDSIEYLIYVGMTMKNKLGKYTFGGDELNQIRQQIQKYFEVLGDTLAEFGKTYGSEIVERYRQLPLIEMIENNDDKKFLTMLANNITKHHTLYTVKETEGEWAGRNYE